MKFQGVCSWNRIRPNIPKVQNPEDSLKKWEQEPWSDWYSWWTKSLDHLRYINYCIYMWRPIKKWEILQINWCLISSIKSISTSPYFGVSTHMNSKNLPKSSFLSFPNGYIPLFSNSAIQVPWNSPYHISEKTFLLITWVVPPSQDSNGKWRFRSGSPSRKWKYFSDEIASWAGGQPNLETPKPRLSETSPTSWSSSQQNMPDMFFLLGKHDTKKTPSGWIFCFFF